MKTGSITTAKCSTRSPLVSLIDFKFILDNKTLVFDLDETLVRVQKEEPDMEYDTRINVVDQASQTNYFVRATMMTGRIDICKAAALPL